MANGLDNTTVAGTSWLLPFTPQTNHVYLLTAIVSFTNDPGNWVGFGFSKFYTNNLTIGNGRFTDTPLGYDWMILTENTGNVQYFGGAGTANTIFGANNEFPVGPGTNTVQIILNT